MHLQNTVDVRDKMDALCSRIATLEKRFEKPASDEKETKRREELSMYANGLHSGWMLISS